MPNRRVTALMASALVLAASVALAQSPSPAASPSTSVSPLTVEGKLDPKVIQQQTQTFVQSYAATPNPNVDQIARWHDPVCVNVLGLPRADQAAAIKARIEGAAQAVGLRAARKGCKANVEIAFTAQPQAMMDLIAKDREQLLGYEHRAKRDQLKMVTHPIQAWYSTATRGEGHDNGKTFATHYDAFGKPMYLPREGDAAEVADDPENPAPTACQNPSAFSACLESEFSHVFIVADAKQLKGKDLNTLSDYLVMLALSQPQSLDYCNVLPSVLDLLTILPCAGRAAPDGLTASDGAYLTALYASNPQAIKAGELTDIAGRMAKLLIQASASGQ